MWFLDRLGDNASWRDLHELAVEFEDFLGPGLDDDFEGLAHFGAGAVVIDAETVKFLRGGRASGAEFHAAVAHDVEDGGLLCYLDWVVELEGQQADAVGDADVFGALADGTVKDFGRGAVGVFLEEVMLDFPDIVHADAVGEFNLRERLPVNVVLALLVPWARGFHLVKQAELHIVLRQAKA